MCLTPSCEPGSVLISFHPDSKPLRLGTGGKWVAKEVKALTKVSVSKKVE